MSLKIDFKAIALQAFQIAQDTIGLTGAQKMDYALDLIIKLDNATPLAIIPDGLERIALKVLCQKIYDEVREHIIKK